MNIVGNVLEAFNVRTQINKIYNISRIVTHYVLNIPDNAECVCGRMIYFKAGDTAKGKTKDRSERVVDLITLCGTHLLWLTITPHRSMIKLDHPLHINPPTHTHTHTHTHTCTFTVIKKMILRSEGRRGARLCFLTPSVIVIRIRCSLQSPRERQWRPFPHYRSLIDWKCCLCTVSLVDRDRYSGTGPSIRDRDLCECVCWCVCRGQCDEISGNTLIDFKVLYELNLQ